MKREYNAAFSQKSTVSSVTKKRPASSSGKKAQSEKGKTLARTQSFSGNNNNKSIRTEATQSTPGRQSQQSTASKTVSTKINATGGIVKTVILPYDEINNIKSELEYLKEYKARQKALYEEAIQGFQKDKVIRLQEFQMKE